MDKKTEALKLALELALDVRANAGARLAAKAIALTGVIDAALAEQPAQQQEPFCYFYIENGEEFFAPKNAYVPDDAKPLYTSPQASKPWVGLTQQEQASVLASVPTVPFDGDWHLALLTAIEAKLREKNAQPSKPLTDEQRNWIVATCPTPRHIIDTVEKMHGIKE